MLIDELAERRFNAAKTQKIRRVPTDPLKPLFHPDQHILPALRCLEAACAIALKDAERARKFAWQAIKHAEICDMPKVIRSAKALLGVL